jgi:hypothetical protein
MDVGVATRLEHAGGALRRLAPRAFTVAAAWAAVALLFSVFGYVTSVRRGLHQPWWPSLGYALAIFSVWALLTWPVAAFVRWIEARVRGLPRRLALYALGLPAASALHVFLFAVIYWPAYNDAGRIPTRWAMGERMLLANLDTNALLYTLLVGGFTAAAALKRRRTAEVTGAVIPPRPDDALTIRTRGGFVRVPLGAIDRIEAAGDYCEVRAGGAVHLIDEPLSSLAGRLPADRFARIHRRALVALDRIAEVRGVGRGDALVRLADGTELRLSRRYRGLFLERLGARSPAAAVPLAD